MKVRLRTRRFRPPLRYGLLALLLLLHSTGLVAQEKNDAIGGEVSDHSGEAFIVEKSTSSYRFEPDGTARETFQVRARVQSEAGVNALGQLVFDYNAENEELEIEHVRVRKPDGEVVQASRDDVQDRTAPVARVAPVYTDARQRHVSVPRLRPGDILEYRLDRRVEPFTPGHFSMAESFWQGVVVLDETIEVDVPAETPVRFHSTRDPSVSEEGDRKIYRWTYRNTASTEDDLTGAAGEARAPDIQVSSFGSWAEVGDWYWDLQRERSDPGPQIRDKAEELLEGVRGDLERIRTLYRYVSADFRYVGLSFGIGRFQPHAAADVLSNGYGDCKDKHTLLAALLEAAGYRSFPVLINSAREIEPGVPAPSQFDHLITAVPVHDTLIWLDSTSGVAPFRFLPFALRGKQALVVRPEGRSGLVETLADPPFANTESVRLEGRISSNGTLTARVSHVVRGDPGFPLRAIFRTVPSNRWQELAQRMIAYMGLPGEAHDLDAGDPLATEEPFAFSYSITAPDYVDPGTEQLNLPFPTIRLPDADSLGEAAEDPMQLGVPLTFAAHLEIAVPEDFRIRTPVPVSANRDYATYGSTYRIVDDNRISAERRLTVVQSEIPLARVDDYAAFVRTIERDEDQRTALRMPERAGADEPSASDIAGLHAAGLDALRDEDFERAIGFFERVVELAPEHEFAWNNLGRSYLKMERLDEAESALRTQIEVDPFDEYAYNNLGQVLEELGRSDEALAAYRKQIEINPLDQYASANVGTLLHGEQRFSDAIPYLETAIRITPDRPYLRAALADAYQKVGRHAEAQQLLQELLPSATADSVSVEIHPGAEGLVSAGYAARQQGRTAAAVDLYERAAEIDPEYPEVWSRLGNAYIELEDYDGAIEALRRQIEIDPSTENAYLDLGWALEQKGNRRAAIEAYREQLELDTSSLQTHTNLSMLLFEMRRFEEAATKLERAVSVFAEEPALWMTLGRSYLELGRGREAMRSMEEAARLASRDPEAGGMLARIFHYMGDYDRALPAARDAVELTPEDARLWALLGRLEYLKGARDRARDALAEALRLDSRVLEELPETATIWEELQASR